MPYLEMTEVISPGEDPESRTVRVFYSTALWLSMLDTDVNANVVTIWNLVQIPSRPSYGTPYDAGVDALPDLRVTVTQELLNQIQTGRLIYTLG